MVKKTVKSPKPVSSVLCRFGQSFVLLLLLVASLSPGANSSAFPGTGAPLAAARRLTAEGDPDNPFSYPLLKDMSRSLARNGFPATFFLGLDNNAGPGVDLRTILLYEAGILKSPVKFFATSRKKRPQAPTLTVNSFPESSGQMPVLGPRLSAPGSLESEPSAVPAGNKESKAAGKDHQPLSLDFNRFSLDLFNPAPANEISGKLLPDTPEMAMVPPLALETKLSGTPDESFRFWTVPQAVAVPDAFAARKADYAGSFVMMSCRGLKAVEGRTFVLVGGHALASACLQGLVIDTPVAAVSVESGTTAYVEIIKGGVARIRVLESDLSEHAVSVQYTAENKPVRIRLSAGDDFLVADHKLTEKEKSLQGGVESTGGAESSSKRRFSVRALLDSDSFFSSTVPLQNPEQRSAVALLRKRIK